MQLQLQSANAPDEKEIRIAEVNSEINLISILASILACLGLTSKTRPILVLHGIVAHVPWPVNRAHRAPDLQRQDVAAICPIRWPIVGRLSVFTTGLTTTRMITMDTTHEALHDHRPAGPHRHRGHRPVAV